MIYQLGFFFLLGTMSVRSASLTSCSCPRDLRPVCGSDGRTYSNHCQLLCAQLSNPELLVEKMGRCESDSQESCSCSLENNPVCGSDGRTYDNPCALACAQRSTSVELSHMGKCGPAQWRVKREQRYCPCSGPDAPVCGTNGQSYPNSCILDCWKYYYPDLRIKHDGNCEYAVEGEETKEES